MDKLIATSRIVFANNFVLYFKSASYHWNVESFYFPQFHDFFGDFYADTYGAIDTLAEFIRTFDAYAPISISEVIRYKTVDEDTIKPDNVNTMLTNLLAANVLMIESLESAFEASQEVNEQGYANFLADRLTTHKKHQWMLKSILK
jgi:starvation-inducible DNA-binding protein